MGIISIGSIGGLSGAISGANYLLYLKNYNLYKISIKNNSWEELHSWATSASHKACIHSHNEEFNLVNPINLIIAI